MQATVLKGKATIIAMEVCENWRVEDGGKKKRSFASKDWAEAMAAGVSARNFANLLQSNAACGARVH
eukprot:6460801-Amphidinium_carterae.1